MSTLEVWYAHLDMDELLPQFQALWWTRRRHRVCGTPIAKARAHDSHQAYEKLCYAHRTANPGSSTILR